MQDRGWEITLKRKERKKEGRKERRKEGGKTKEGGKRDKRFRFEKSE